MASDNLVPIWVKKETKFLLLKTCKQIYLEHHPEMEHVNITHDKILYEIGCYYEKD